MAENARSERQFMRQRGAGGREVALADFDFEFRADSREDRQLMRQRGAGNRQVDAVDFGFHFATPSTVRSRRSRVVSQSPGTATRHNGASRKTPEPAAGLLPPSSAQSFRGEASRSIHGGSPAQLPPRKRRRLSEISNMTRASSLPLPSVGAPNALSEVLEIRDYSVQQQENVPSSALFFSASKPDIANTVDRENDSSLLSNSSKTSTKRRKRKSIGQQAMRNKKRRSNSTRPLPTPPQTQQGSLRHTETSEGVSIQEGSSRLQKRQSRRWSVESREPGSTIDNRFTQPVSQGDSPRSHQPLDNPYDEVGSRTREDDQTAGEPSSISEIPVDSIEEEEMGIYDLDDKSEADESSLGRTNQDDTREDNGPTRADEMTPQLKDRDEDISYHDDTGEQHSDAASHSRFIALDIPNVENEEEADEDYVPEQNPPAKVVKRRPPCPKQAGSRLSRSRSEEPRRQRQPKKPGVPILTYRITNVGKLPTIDEAAHEDATESDGNEFTRAPPAFTSRKSANAVDVLRQACHEAIDVRIEELQDSGLSRAELNNCITALQSFKTALHTQLFLVSQSLDQRLNLEARVRKSRKEKAALQARWLEIRQQRDWLDLRKDEIRRKCWESKILEEKRFQASQAAFALEHAIGREEEDDETENRTAAGLEFRLRTVAKDVSSQVGGGILQDLKRFNALLESFAKTSS